MTPRNKSVPTYETRSFAATITGASHERSLAIKARPYFQTFLNRFKPGDQLTVVITDKKPKRTEAQHRYYFVFLSEIAAETGNEVEDLHELFKAKFLPRKRVDVLGETVERGASTKSLTRTEFGEYIDKIAAMTGIMPPPTEAVRGL